MPIYEYVCEHCGQPTEALQKLSDPPLVDCPHCGQSALRKKVSAAAFRLKGGGWYETDFKQGSKKNLAGDAGAEGGKTADKDAGSGSAPEGGGKAAGDSSAGSAVSAEKKSTEKKPAGKPSGDSASTS